MRRRWLPLFGSLPVIGMLFTPAQALCQPPPPPIAPAGSHPTVLTGPVRVFIDCGGFWPCDSAYFVTNLTLVDHVRDREVADVHVLITGRSTGSGGMEATVTFLGRELFLGVQDVLTCVLPPNASNDAVRAALLKALTLGLTRYVSHSPAGKDLQITMPAANQLTPEAPKHDPWHYWVMRIRFNGSANGEQSTRFGSYSGGVSASRVTKAWKINLSSSGSYRQSTYDFDEGDVYTSIQRSLGFSGLVARSITAQWSVGARGSVQSSTYNNHDRAVHVAPAVEYNFFPYDQSTRRLLTLQYALGVSSFNYREVTLYDKSQETAGTHSLALDLEARQPWGQISTSVDVSQFLPLTDKYRVESWGQLEIKIKKGLSCSIGGGVSWIRDQIYLPAGGASREDVLVRQRQLATSYSYSVYFGASYTFGSIYNNIVNPRFGSGGGGMTIRY